MAMRLKIFLYFFTYFFMYLFLLYKKITCLITDTARYFILFEVSEMCCFCNFSVCYCIYGGGANDFCELLLYLVTLLKVLGLM